jgi:hypothetical protein
METYRRVIARSRWSSGIYDILAAKSSRGPAERMDAIFGGCGCLRSILGHPVQVLQMNQRFETWQSLFCSSPPIEESRLGLEACPRRCNG